MPDESVDLVVTSPPYNLGKPYEQRVSLGDYLIEQKEVISQLHRVLRDTGSICWQVGNYLENGEVFPLDIFYYDIFKALGMKLRNRIVWHFGHGLHASKRFSGRYETLLWFSKSDNYKFNLDAVRVPQKYPSKRHFKGVRKGELSGNPNGKNPSDFWGDLGAEWGTGVWEIPNVKSNHPEKTSHPCQFPVELAERCVLALTDLTDLVLDPYSGVASTAIAAVKNDRRAIGVEQSAQYTEIGQKRIKALGEGTLNMRPMQRPIHSP
jgi:DNA modification methylase